MREILLTLIFGLAAGWTIEETGWSPVPDQEVTHEKEQDNSWKSEMWFSHNSEH